MEHYNVNFCQSSTVLDKIIADYVAQNYNRLGYFHFDLIFRNGSESEQVGDSILHSMPPAAVGVREEAVRVDDKVRAPKEGIFYTTLVSYPVIQFPY